jgi:hypothetical protein
MEMISFCNRGLNTFLADAAQRHFRSPAESPPLRGTAKR